MNLSDFITIIIVGLVFACAIFYLVRQKKRGETCCGCSAKPGDANCHCSDNEKIK